MAARITVAHRMEEEGPATRAALNVNVWGVFIAVVI